MALQAFHIDPYIMLGSCPQGVKAPAHLATLLDAHRPVSGSYSSGRRRANSSKSNPIGANTRATPTKGIGSLYCSPVFGVHVDARRVDPTRHNNCKVRGPRLDVVNAVGRAAEERM